MRILTVTGLGCERIPTAIAQVYLSVEAQGKIVQVVQKEIARRSAAVVALLRARNVEWLETTGISFSPDYSPSNRRQLIGFTGHNTLSFRMPAEQEGDLLEEVVQAGASNINGVSFVATEDAIAKARHRALQEATLDAQNQAQAVLAALNFQAGEIIGIAINRARVSEPKPIPFVMTVDATVAKSPETMGAEQQIEASVTLKISY
jgi:uncharacterized protein